MGSTGPSPAHCVRDPVGGNAPHVCPPFASGGGVPSLANRGEGPGWHSLLRCWGTGSPAPSLNQADGFPIRLTAQSLRGTRARRREASELVRKSVPLQNPAAALEPSCIEANPGASAP